MTTKTEPRSWRMFAFTKGTGQPPDYPDFGQYDGKSYSYTAQAVDTVTYGENYKDWKKRLAEMQNATTSLSGVRHTYPRKQFIYFIKVNKSELLYSGTISGTLVPSEVNTSVEQLATSMAKQDFTKKARQRLHRWQGGVFAGELRETARLLASPTKRLRIETGNLLDQLLKLKRRSRIRLPPTPPRSLNELRRRKALAQLELDLKGIRSNEYRKAVNSLRRAIGDTWLEWSFGVKPLIQDIEDAKDAFNEVRSGRSAKFGDSIRIVGRAVYAESSSIETGVPIFPGIPNYTRCTRETRDDCVAIVRAAYRDFNPAGDMPLAKTFGLDLSSILPTAWELLPWSFLVDYFTDVGNAIDAWSIRLVDFAWSNSTIRNSRTVRLFGGRVTLTAPNYGYFYCPGRYIASGTRVSTTRSTGLPPMEVYRPSFRIPGYTSTKWLNLAALTNGIVELNRR